MLVCVAGFAPVCATGARGAGVVAAGCRSFAAGSGLAGHGFHQPRQRRIRVHARTS